jgi:hypothetical protein
LLIKTREKPGCFYPSGEKLQIFPKKLRYLSYWGLPTATVLCRMPLYTDVHHPWSLEQRSAQPIPSRIIATCFALVSFAAAVAVGMAVDNPISTIIWRATLIMLACWLVGRLFGGLLERVVREHVDEYKRANPIPPLDLSVLDRSASDPNQDVQRTQTSGTAQA